jgi:hypothetical protein
MKIAIFTLLGFILLLLLVAAVSKKEYTVERSISINRSKTEVFDFARYLRNQDKFSVWAKIDPDMKQEFRGTDGAVGFVSAWDSDVKEAGKGEQEIIRIDEGSSIDYEIRFFKPMRSTNNASLTFESLNDSSTLVKWRFFGKMKYPMNIMLIFMNMDAMLGKDLEGGLHNLKDLLESS